MIPYPQASDFALEGEESISLYPSWARRIFARWGFVGRFYIRELPDGIGWLEVKNPRTGRWTEECFEGRWLEGVFIGRRVQP